MAEERETTQIETPEETAAALPIMPAAGHLALAMGLQGAAENPNLAKATGDLLAKQSAMLDVQMEDLHEQRQLQISHLRLRRWGEWLSLILRGLSVAGGIAVAFALAVVVWQARNASGIIITPFSVPPDLAATGLTGDVVANRLLDRLAELQEQTDSARAPDTFRNAGEDDIRVEIPETGVSLGELLKLLHGWLGHETHITGDVVRMNGAITVTSRVGETPGRSFTGDPAKLDDLIKQAAETVYARTQPYRYGVYLSRNGRNSEALEVMKALALKGPESERAWGYIGWAFVEPDIRATLPILRKGLEKNPNLAAGWAGLAERESNLGHDEAALSAIRRSDYLLQGRRGAGGVAASALPQTRLSMEAFGSEALGSYASSALAWSRLAEAGTYNSLNLEAGAREAISAALNHDPSLLDEPARWNLADASPYGFLLRAKAEIARAMATDSWGGVGSRLRALELSAKDGGQATYSELVWQTQIHPWLAYADARGGSYEIAREQLNATPQDCYTCLRARGLVDLLAGNLRSGEAWLIRATKSGPSLPFAFRDLAELAIARGEFLKALGYANKALELGPNWPDAMLTRGQVHSRMGECPLARADFTEASRRAPAWSLPAKLAAACATPQPPKS